MNKYIKGSIYSLLFVATLILSTFQIAEADIGGGSGGGASGGTAQFWIASGDPWSGSGTTAAWSKFQSINGSKRYQPVAGGAVYDLKGMIDYAGRNGMGGFGGETLYDSCRKSEFIWWYGPPAKDVSRDSDKEMYSRAGNNHTFPVEQANAISKSVWSTFTGMPKSTTGWGNNPGVILVCSGSFTEPEPPVPLTFTSKSGDFIYNGNPKTVSGYSLTTGDLKKGHSHTATATRTRTNVGTYSVPFTSSAKITSGSTNVTDEYEITHKTGSLKIVSRLSPSDGTRCKTTDTVTITEIVQNDVSIANGFSPEGSPGVAAVTKENTNDAYDLLSSMPTVGQSKATWNTWKGKFEAGGEDLTTKKFDLESHSNAANVLSKYGGVINITRTHHPYEVETVLCQPQKRDQVLKYDSKGEPYSSWSSWYDDTSKSERIKSISSKAKTVENYSYQILGVNCNVDGLNTVKNNFNTVDGSLGDGTASGFIETAERSGLHFPLGKTSHYTGKENFYKPDGVRWDNSCEDAYVGVCTSDILGSSASNDADNNLQHEPLFTHEDAEHEGGHGYPNEDSSELNFFRDNEDREVRAEVWYPGETGKTDLVNFPGAAAKRTTAKIFDNEFGTNYTPTPEIEVTTIAPWGTTDEFTSTGSEKEWNSHINHFNMKSKWSSDEDKPYALGVDWAYDATAKNVSPKNIDGYKVLDKTSVKEYTFEAHCTFQNEVGNYDANITPYPFNPDGGSIKVNADWDSAGKLKTLFTRSVSDKSNR